MDSLRPLLWIAFAFVLFLLYQAWQEDHTVAPMPDAAAPVAATLTGAHAPSVALPAAPSTAVSAAAPASKPAAIATAISPAVVAANDGTVAPSTGKRISVLTDVLAVELDTQGGDLVTADLLEYSVVKGQPTRVRLLDLDGPTRAAARSGLRGADGVLLDRRTVWSTSADSFALAAGSDALEVVLQAPFGPQLVAEKVYSFKRGDYAVGLTLRVRNASAAPWHGDAYLQIEKRVVPIKRSLFSSQGYSYEGVAYHDGTKYQKLKPGDLDEKPFEQQISGGWIAELQHHFLVAAVPGASGDPKPQSTYYARGLGEQDYVSGFVLPAQDIAAGGAGEFRTTLFVGPKLQDRLATVAPGLELSTDYGMFTIFAQPLFWLLEKLHWLLGNWGWSIIGLTILVKAAFYKLAETSGRSMAKMRTVAPKLEQLKERFKDDRTKLNEAMLELYRKEKINPVAGCLPVLIQLPVFIALYWVLLESVEMRQAPWMLWVQDLSSKDPYFVLPLLMGGAMWAQMKLNPPPPDPVQAKVMQFMPIMFTGMSMFFPAGLTLYWLLNTGLSVLQQWQINKVVEREAAARRS